ncbi:hypothetical protein QF117_06475 [Vibrio sp. YMD68]|nr:hypothetical protein [Vibrio sp. YMD68]WGW00483.1 hypothetical protein QF117_06475 [Vibrio sp. YMD68]
MEGKVKRGEKEGGKRTEDRFKRGVKKMERGRKTGLKEEKKKES